MLELRPFQRRFLRAALAPGVRTAALSLPRGNGKSTLAAHVLERCLTPGDALYEPGAEYLLGAASLEGARHVYRPLRAALEPTGEYRFIDSVTRIGVVHKRSNTRLRVQSSNAKTAFGIVGTPLAVLDEPGAWEVNAGTLLADAMFGAQGKPESALRLLFIGTLSPATGGWWHDLVHAGSGRGVHVTALAGDAETWDSWPTIRKANPLMAAFPESRAQLLAERNEARADPRLKARFLSYRLNTPTADASTTLLTVDDWKGVCGRVVPRRDGRPLVGVDLGGGRAWSAAVSLYRNGRMEALALAPGIPSIEDQERRDRVSRGTYGKLVDSGHLYIADGLRVQTAAQLVDIIREAWPTPAAVVADRFRLPTLEDAGLGPLEARMTRWSESTEDIRALRSLALDGPLACETSSAPLIAESLAVSKVKNDDSGNVRMLKSGTNNTGRDDVAAALVLVAGLYARRTRTHRRSNGVYRGTTSS